MVTDVILQNAAAEAECTLLASLMAEREEVHVFSEAFEKKMKKVVSREKHPVRYQVLRYAAAIVLVIATLFGTVMAVSPDARAAVVGWFRTVFYGPYIHYDNQDVYNIPDAAAEMALDYYLPVAPEGYNLVREIGRLQGKTYLYISETGKMLSFAYQHATGIGGVYMDVEGYNQEAVKVGTLTADFYTTTEEGQTNVIAWISEHGGVMFTLSADLDKEAIIALAESVQYRELPEEASQPQQ